MKYCTTSEDYIHPATSLRTLYLKVGGNKSFLAAAGLPIDDENRSGLVDVLSR